MSEIINISIGCPHQLFRRYNPAVHEDRISQVSIKPENDARLPILEARIENDWQRWRPRYYRELKKAGRLKQQIHQTAIMCVEIMHQFQNRGLNPDQAREVIQELIIPPAQ